MLVGVNKRVIGRLSLCSPAMNWHLVRVSPCLHPITARRGSRSPTHPELRKKQILKIDGQMDGYHLDRKVQTRVKAKTQWWIIMIDRGLSRLRRSNANEQPSLSLSSFSHLPDAPPPTLPPSPCPSTTISSSSCSESSLQFVPLPHTSLFKMTLLHFTANQLFCLTQSTGSASQPAWINWGAREWEVVAAAAVGPVVVVVAAWWRED